MAQLVSFELIFRDIYIMSRYKNNSSDLDFL